LLPLQLPSVGRDGKPPAVANVLMAPPTAVPLPAVVEPLVNSAT